MVAEFSKAYKALGGEIVSVTPYNEKQASYQAEVTAAMEGDPDGALSRQLSGRRRDDRPAMDLPGRAGEVPAERRHERQGLHRRMSAPKYLNDAFGTSSGTDATPSTEYFNANYKAFSGLDPGSPGRRPGL